MPASGKARILRGWLVGLLLAAPGLAFAQLHEVDFGDLPGLDVSEILPLVPVVNDVPLQSPRLTCGPDFSRVAVLDLESAEAAARAQGSLKSMDWMSRAFPRIKKKYVFRFASVPVSMPSQV